MTTSSLHRFIRAVRPWWSHLVLVMACAVVLATSPRGVHRVVLETGGIAKEVQGAWSRWMARRAGVVVLCRGNPNDRASIDGRNIDFRSQCSFGKTDRQCALNVLADPSKERVRGNIGDHVKITGRSAV